MEKPKILFLGSQMEVGGAQRVLLTQAHWFASQGWAVVVAFLYDKDGLYPLWSQKYDFRIVNLKAKSPGNSKFANFFAFFRGIWNLLYLMSLEHFDGIETFTHHSNLIGLPLAFMMGIPVRLGSHHGRLFNLPAWFEPVHSWVVNHFATWVVAVSKGVLVEAVKDGIYAHKLKMVPNGIYFPESDQSKIDNIRSILCSKHIPLILIAGRMTEVKGQTYFLQAAQRVLRKFPETVFAIAGDGPLRSDLETEAKTLGIDQQVKFLGVRSDILYLMAAADIFCLTSLSEGLPMTIIEAMGMGTAVVSTRATGVEEVVRHNETGMLVEVADVNGLAVSLEKLIVDHGLRKSLAEAGKKMVQSSFTANEMCQQYAELFKSTN